MVAAGFGFAAGAVHLSGAATHLQVMWWELAPAFLLAEVFAFHLEYRGEAHSFTLSELPLVIGLLFASPLALIAGRLAGEAAFFGFVRRQPPKKLFFNLSIFLAESGAALVLFRILCGGRSPLQPVSWAVVLLAVTVPDLASSLAVWFAIRWHGGRPELGPNIAASAIVALVNVSLALWAALILAVRPVGLVLFAPVGVTVAASYLGYARLRQRYAGLQRLYDFTKAVGSSARTGSTVKVVLAESRKLLHAASAEVVLLAGAGSDEAVRQRDSERCRDELDVLERAELAPYHDAGELVRPGRALLLGRAAKNPVEIELRARLQVREAMVAPLWLEDELSGWLIVADRLGEVRGFDEQDRRLFETLANHASVAFRNARLIEQSRQEAVDRRYEALHDALTGLPNRAAFMAEVSARLGGAGRCAVILMDLDGFKEINDTLGHNVGDMVLREVATRLDAVVGEAEAVARLGGDEFAVIVAGDSLRDRTETAAAGIAAALAGPILVDELTLEVGVSAGIALSPEHGSDAETLLQHADVAMYAAKAGRSGAVVYSPERDSYSPRRLALAGELRPAIEQGNVQVYYQPKARLCDGAVVAVEALVRWRHPRHGFLPPDEFIPVAEATGVISPLTVHVLDSALAQCATWRESGRDVGVAVNLSVRSLLDADLPGRVSELLARHAVPAGQLTLELTETSVMADPVRSIAALERLAAIGVRLSVDDFGTGSSSFTYLQRLPVQEVKIDKAFVLHLPSNAGDAMIVRSIVELGHNLSLSVVAEGVEDERSWQLLRAMGCDVAQGFLLSPPVSAGELTRWLEHRSGAPAPAPSPMVAVG
jgi:diguanylate cyclase (GGDEF)-like protein